MTAAPTLALEPTAPSSGAARRWVRARLEELGLEPLTDAVTLLTSEVVTNAVLHAATALRVGVSRDGAGVRVEVHDESPVPPSRRRHPVTSTVGRGLTMLDTVADEWGWRRDGTGKVVWFRVEHPRDAWPEPSLSATALGGAFDEAALDGASDSASGLGRYSPEPAQQAPFVRITLLRLPLRLLVASQEHHDGLLRELRLLALSGDDADGRADDSRLAELVHALGQQYATARPRRDEEVDAALARGEGRIDQSFSVPPTAAEAMQRVAALLDDADTFCKQNLLMTLARPPLVRRFAAWYLEEVVEQSRGRDPRPWDGPLDLPPAHP
jgi:anti-sigma regulatory factor (Ser/Thr protein kinase)